MEENKFVFSPFQISIKTKSFSLFFLFSEIVCFSQFFCSLEKNQLKLKTQQQREKRESNNPQIKPKKSIRKNEKNQKKETHNQQHTRTWFWFPNNFEKPKEKRSGKSHDS